MKFVKVMAGLALAAMPMFAAANSVTPANVEAGGISQEGPLPIYDDDDAIPAGAIIVGGLVLLGGVIVGIAASDSDGGSTTSTTSTTSQ